jgi:hypothetical protein
MRTADRIEPISDRSELAQSRSDKASTSEFWMRSISFAGLHRILHVLAERSEGLTPAELNSIIVERRIYETQRKLRPAPATLYHCRNTLLKLSAVLRNERRLVVNSANPHVQTLLLQSPSEDCKLDGPARESFSELVLINQACRRCFFDLFMPDANTYTAQEFREAAVSVVWKSDPNGDKTTRTVIFEATHSGRIMNVHSASEINAVLYGLRYWALDELQLADEFFCGKRGSVMYPIVLQKRDVAVEEIIEEILLLCGSDGDEWTTLSVQGLIESCGEKRRRPVAHVFDAIRRLARLHSGEVVLIPTSRSFASISAGFNQQRQDLELRSRLRDSQGRYISHIRIHDSLRSLQHV